MLLCVSVNVLFAQVNPVISGPWAGNVELRTAMIWAEVGPAAKTVSVTYHPLNRPANSKTVKYKGVLKEELNPLKIELTGLEMNTTYLYFLSINGTRVKTTFETKFKTRDLWQYRKPAPDLVFLAGSCSYFNEPEYDRPGIPYGKDSSIFETMARTPADFHLWLGDSWYTREVDYTSAWGLQYRASRDRRQKVLQPLMAAMPQYGIWDDHDFGPNDGGKHFILKDESRAVFKKYTLNPSYGQDGKGIYTKLSYSDVDFFLTDDRYFRSEADMPDSVDGKPSLHKTFFGDVQLDWLMNSLLNSRATFKIIVVGSQVLNSVSRYDCLCHYGNEYTQLMRFLSDSRINGVIFFSGDRHHSEIIRQDRGDLYPLYDVTVSPYTSGIYALRGEEKDNAMRVANSLIEVNNFARVSVTGKKNERTLKVEFLGTRADKLYEWVISESSLRNPGR